MQLVAPAGSFDGLRASVKGGADAVYLGMSQFGARAKAQNFDEGSLSSAIEYAHLFGVKVFVTLNTLIKDNELSSALKMAKQAYDAGADAAIVQDLRLVKALKTSLPDFVLHASTQMGIHNAEGARVLADIGIKRAVLSRETLPEDIVEIKKTGIEIEYFVQGALCIGFSGNCYFSSLASSYSGNRGKCMQLCRKPYLFNGKRGYFLSAKDLCLYGKLAELEKLGVDAIKIEGRMRSPEYAFRAAEVYRSYLQKDDAIDALKDVFNRGDYCTGYIDERAEFNVVYPRTQSNIGKYIGKIDAARGNKITVNGFKPNASDGFKIMRSGKEVCGATVRQGEIVSEVNCKRGDELRRTFDGSVTESLKNAERKLDVKVEIKLSAGNIPVVKLISGSTVTEATGKFIPQTAVSQSLSDDDIKRVFNKTSEYPFAPDISVVMDDGLFMPISALNELRRYAYELHRSAIVNNYKIVRSDSEYRGLNYNKFDGNGKILMVENAEQLDAEIISAVDYVVLNPKDYSDFDIPQLDKPVLLNLPITMRGSDRDIILKAIDRDGICGVVSNNLYALSLTDKPILLGTGHNIIGETDLPHVRSFEADSIGSGFVYVFGYAPLMTLCHCPYGRCVDCSGIDVLTDDGGRRFTMRRFRSGHCYWQLLNCVPHYLTLDIKNKFYDCTAVDKKTISDVLNGKYRGDFTRGNLNKGLK